MTEIVNKHTFNEESVKITKDGNEPVIIHIGKNCYTLTDLDKIVKKAKVKYRKSADESFIEALNYRIVTYTDSE